MVATFLELSVGAVALSQALSVNSKVYENILKNFMISIALSI